MVDRVLSRVPRASLASGKAELFFLCCRKKYGAPGTMDVEVSELFIFIHLIN